MFRKLRIQGLVSSGQRWWALVGVGVLTLFLPLWPIVLLVGVWFFLTAFVLWYREEGQFWEVTVFAHMVRYLSPFVLVLFQHWPRRFAERRWRVDLAKLAEVVGVSSGNSSVFSARAEKFVLADEYEPAFRMDLMRKDMLLAVELAQQVAAATPVAAAALQQYTAALNEGLADLDFSAVAKLSERAAGVEFKEGR